MIFAGVIISGCLLVGFIALILYDARRIESGDKLLNKDFDYSSKPNSDAVTGSVDALNRH